MRKSIVFLILIALLATQSIHSPVHAATIIGQGRGEDGLLWTVTDDGTLSIDGTGPMADYSYSYDTGLTAPWGAYKDSIRTVFVGYGVTSIGQYAFAKFESLERVDIAHTVTSIGENAFFYCGKLERVVIPPSVTAVGDYAFNCCFRLYTVHFSGEAPVIGENAFTSVSAVVSYYSYRNTWSTDTMLQYGGKLIWLSEEETLVDSGTLDGGAQWQLECQNDRYLLRVLGNGPMPDFSRSKDVPWIAYNSRVHQVQISEGITAIGQYAFYGFSKLTEVTVPEGVASIGQYAFQNCGAVTEFALPESLTYIGISAFTNCSSLESILIPSKVSKIDLSAFDGCNKLLTVKFTGDMPAMDHTLFSNLTLTIRYPADNDTWNKRWFYLYKGNLTWMPDAGEYMVGGECGENLTWWLDYDGKLTISGKGPMEDYPRYWSAPWSDYKEHLKSVVVEDGVTHIGADAFSFFGGITSVSLPDSVTSIGSSAFYRCGISSIDIPCSVTSLGEDAFYRCEQLQQVTFSEGLLSVGENAFYGCGKLEKVHISSTVKHLTSNAFAECYALSSITVAENSPYFVCHDGLTLLNKEETKLILLSNAYTGAFAVPETVTEISPEALRGCIYVTAVTMTDSVTIIGPRAFWGCHTLRELVLSPSLAKIPSQMVSYCSELGQLVIPQSVVLADSSAFADASGLTHVLFLGDAPQEGGEDLFHYSNEAVTVYRTAEAKDFRETWGGAPVAIWNYTVSGVTQCGQTGQQTVSDDTLGISCTRTLTVPHSFGQWQIETLPTENSAGLWLRTCEKCGHRESRDIPKTPQRPASTTNYSLQNYSVWGDVVGSHLRQLPEGGYERVEVHGDIIVERYTPELSFLWRIDIPRELPRYGGWYCDGSYNYLVFGQTNPDERDDVEVIRVVRYSLSWCRLDSVSLYGGNTIIPFEAGSLRMAHSGNLLYIRTCHEMYASSDGLNHQANMSLTVFIPSMELVHTYVKVESSPTGHVGHSFNQFVLIDGEDYLGVDHGDAYPRAIAICRNKGMAGDYHITTKVSGIVALSIPGDIGDNFTGVSIGGFEASESSYIIAGNYIDFYRPTDQRNIFLSVIPKDSFTAASRNIIQLTAHDPWDDISVSTPHLVKVHENSLCVLWTEAGTLKYAFVDGTGGWDGTVYTADAKLSSCKPILADGKILWYVTNSTIPNFYWIDLSAPDTVHSQHEHPEGRKEGSLSGFPTAVKTGSGTVILCKLCENEVEVELPVLSSENYTVIRDGASCQELSYTTLLWHSQEYGDVEFVYSTGSGPCQYQEVNRVEPTLTAIGGVTLHCTVCGKDISVNFPVLNAENYAVTVTTPATCQAPGQAAYRWEDLFYGEYTFTAALPQTEHSWSQWEQTVAPNEKEDGVNTRTCAACGTSETETVDNNPFTDVRSDRFEEPILWAYYNGITSGTGDGTTFSPEDTCTRKQIVTFLWRAAGEPEPKSMKNPFTDVRADRFEKAILWAFYEGITTGTGDGTTFSPESTCTRKQIVTFLWRFHGEPAPKETNNSFVDVKADRFEDAILWAYYQGITTGTGDGSTFSGDNPCTRKQIVTFLYRDLVG